MIALLRKDSPWIRVCGVAGIVVLSIAIMEEGFANIWVVPPLQLSVVFKAGWLCGAILGVVASTFDELLRTRDFLQHRPRSPRAMHAALVLGCAIVLTLWCSIPPMIAWADEVAFGVNADLGQPAQVTYVWLVLVPAATATAIGLFAFALPFSMLLRLFVGAAMLLTVFTIVADWSQSFSEHSFPALARSRRGFCILHVGATGIFLLASFVVAGARRDSDRPSTRSALFLGSATSTLALGLIASALVGACERRECGKLLALYPDIRRIVDGDYLLTQWTRGDVYLRVDEEHRVLEPLYPGPTEPVFWSGPRQNRMHGFRAPRFHWRSDSSHQFLDDGRLLAWTQDRHTGRYTVVRAGKGSGDSPFTSWAVLVSAPRGASMPGGHQEFSLWVHEPDAGELWKFDASARHFVVVPLPNEDRLNAFGTVAQVHGYGDVDVLIVERGAYRFENGQLVAVSDSLRRRILQSEPETKRDQVVSDRDAISPHVRVVDPSGATVFEHRYAPRTAEERSIAMRIFAISTCRPPALAVAAHAFGSAESPMYSFLDPLVAGGRRLWLVAISLALGALCAMIAVFRLWRFGADRRARWFWGVLALSLGPIALVASFVFERRRAWSRGPAPEPTPEPRIVSDERTVPGQFSPRMST